jgi:hypothetical protein
MATPPCLAKPPFDLDDPMPEMLGRHASHDLMIHTHDSALCSLHQQVMSDAWACMQATTAPEMLGHAKTSHRGATSSVLNPPC